MPQTSWVRNETPATLWRSDLSVARFSPEEFSARLYKSARSVANPHVGMTFRIFLHMLPKVFWEAWRNTYLSRQR
jgi:hypothetical protein